MTPDGAIREAIVTGLAVVGILAFDQGVPISSPTPDLFVQIHSQGRTRTAVNKRSYEWMGSVTLSLVKLNQKGYISSVDLDEMDSQVVAFMDGIVLPGFKVQLSRFVRSTSDVIESPTKTISRRHVEYEIWTAFIKPPIPQEFRLLTDAQGQALKSGESTILTAV